MSFSITTLRGFTIKTFVGSAGIATLQTPMISYADQWCVSCGELYLGFRVTGPVGSVIKFKTGNAASSLSVSCDDYTDVTVGNVVYYNGGGGTDEFGCISIAPDGFRAKFIACNGSEFSETVEVYVASFSCPLTIPAPTISIVSNLSNGDGTSTLTYNVKSNYCSDTYITDSSYYPQAPCGQGQAPNPTDAIYQYSIFGSGTTSSNYEVSCAGGSQYHIRAITYFTYGGCTSLQSSESYTYGNLAT